MNHNQSNSYRRHRDRANSSRNPPIAGTYKVLRLRTTNFLSSKFFHVSTASKYTQSRLCKFVQLVVTPSHKPY